jgi:lipopolysaccharide transport system permease protein
VSLWLSALNALYRDVRHSIPFLIQFWLFATPIAYSSSLVPEQFRPLYGLNPMVGVIEGFRWAMLGKGHVGSLIFISALVVILLFWGGLMYFRQVEKNFVDVV